MSEPPGAAVSLAEAPPPADALIARTPTGRLATMRDVVDTVDFLLGNRSVDALNLNVDGGRLLH